MLPGSGVVSYVISLSLKNAEYTRFIVCIAGAYPAVLGETDTAHKLERVHEPGTLKTVGKTVGKRA